MLNKNKVILSACVLAISAGANAGYEYKISDNDSITFGGYV